MPSVPLAVIVPDASETEYPARSIGRQGQHAHERDASADNPAGDAKDGADDHGRQRQRPGEWPKQQAIAVEHPVHDPGALHHVPHEHEERDRDQHVVRHDRKGALHQEVEDVPLEAGEAEQDAERHEREGGGEAEENSQHHDAEHDNAENRLAHHSYGASWTSSKRSGQTPVLSAMTQRNTSAMPCSTVKNPAMGITALKW